MLLYFTDAWIWKAMLIGLLDRLHCACGRDNGLRSPYSCVMRPAVHAKIVVNEPALRRPVSDDEVLAVIAKETGWGRLKDFYQYW